MYYSEILSIDLTCDTAAAKAADEYLGMCFRDYPTLLRIDGRWIVVNKVLHHHIKARSRTAQRSSDGMFDNLVVP